MSERAPDELGTRFWIFAVLGAAVMAYGVWGALDESAATHPRSLATWIVGADLLHDFLIAPLVATVGAAIARVVREPWRTPVRAGVIVTAVVVVVGFPAWGGYGRDRVPDNTSVAPLDYTTAILTVLSGVWLGAALWALARARAARHANER
ncbi:MAG: hypothetical protein ACT4OX_15035 [Actinomycetota bacterium]